jgi:hypothetical protein
LQETPPNKAVKSLEGILKTSHKADKEINKPRCMRHKWPLRQYKTLEQIIAYLKRKRKIMGNHDVRDGHLKEPSSKLSE